MGADWDDIGRLKTCKFYKRAVVFHDISIDSQASQHFDNKTKVFRCGA
jgi:hypothetical protein